MVGGGGYVLCGYVFMWICFYVFFCFFIENDTVAVKMGFVLLLLDYGRGRVG